MLLREREQEFVKLERAVRHVLCDYAAVEVDENVRVLAFQAVLVRLGEQLVAVDASAEQAAVIFEQGV